jgi:hypothetical protein
MPNIPDTSKPRLPICRICWEPVELATGKTDENGQAHHDECFDRLTAQLLAESLRSLSPTPFCVATWSFATNRRSRCGSVQVWGGSTGRTRNAKCFFEAEFFHGGE